MPDMDLVSFNEMAARSETLDSLQAHLEAFIAVYNFAKHLKFLRLRTPFQAISDAWAPNPSSSIRATSSRDYTPTANFDARPSS
jgi:hypothetical protein